MDQINAKALTTGPMRQHAFADAARLASGRHVLADAVRRMDEGEGASFGDAVSKMNATGSGSLRDAFERSQRASPHDVRERGTTAIPAATPAGTPPLMAPAPSSSAAQGLLNRCADAAEKVHGTGKYART